MAAEFWYETGSGTVVFDTARTSPEVFLAELTRLTGFTAEVVEAGQRDAH